MLIRGSFLLAIYGISCCYSLRFQWATGLEDASRKIRPQARPDDSDNPFQTRRFEQKINHFDETDTRQWKQDYYQDNQYYKTGGPVYLWIEGNDFPTAMSVTNKKLYWVSHAKKNNAMLFSISHRFHYFSQIFENKATEDLIYLNVSQVLSDYAAFIEGMNELHDFPANTKWIVFGSSYGGNLAAWMRAKYPKLVHGAVASSAPVLAKMDFSEYLNNVGGSIESYNKQCRTDIAVANEKLDELAKTKTGRTKINETFTLCESLDDNSLSASLLMDEMTSFIAHDMEIDLDNKRVKKMCDWMKKDADTKTPVQRYAQLMDAYLKEYKQKCFRANFDAYINFMQDDEMFASFMSGRTWLYQLCTEFGWFQTTTKKSIFSKNINSEYFIKTCSKTFKPSFNKKFISQAVDKTNKEFGGLKLNTPRTLFVHGSSDPNRNLGITSTKNNKNVEVIIIKGGTCSTDTSYYHLESKNKNRKAAIEKIMATLDSWLKK